MRLNPPYPFLLFLFACACLFDVGFAFSRPFGSCSAAGAVLVRTSLSAEKDNDEAEDDGWETLEELKMSRLEQSRKRSKEVTTSSTPYDEKERDLFIPIFTIVSLAGLFGAYAYEFLRLYLRGELYLPF